MMGNTMWAVGELPMTCVRRNTGKQITKDTDILGYSLRVTITFAITLLSLVT